MTGLFIYMNEAFKLALKDTLQHLQHLFKLDATSWGITSAVACIGLLVGVVPCLIGAVTSVMTGIVAFVVMVLITFFLICVVDRSC